MGVCEWCVYECFIWCEVGGRTTECVSTICVSVWDCLHDYNSVSVCVLVWRDKHFLCVQLMPVGSSNITPTTTR